MNFVFLLFLNFNICCISGPHPPKIVSVHAIDTSRIYIEWKPDPLGIQGKIFIDIM